MTKEEIRKEAIEFVRAYTGAEPREKRIAELEKENAELDCQMNRNKYCYSCASATERCFGNEIGCPCEKYKSYKDENTKLKEENKFLKEQCLILADGNVCNSTCSKLKKQLTKAKKIIRTCLNLWSNVMTEKTVKALIDEAEQFISEVEK